MSNHSSILGFLLPSGVIDNLDNDRLRKLVMTGAGSLASAVTFAGAGVRSLLEHKTFTGLVLCTGALLQLAALIAVRSAKTLPVVSSFVFGTFTLCATLAAAATLTPNATVYTLGVPLFAVSLLGVTAGSIACAVHLGIMLALLGSGTLGMLAPYSLPDLAVYAMNYCSVTLLITAFELARNHADQRSRSATSQLLKLRDDVEKMASEVRQSEQTAQDLIQESREGVLVIQDKVIVQINPRLCEWAGYTVEEVRGTPFSRFIGEEDVKDVVANYHLRMADVAVPPVYEASIKRKDGSTFRGEIRAARFLYKGSYADLVFVTPHDTCTPNFVRKT